MVNRTRLFLVSIAFVVVIFAGKAFACSCAKPDAPIADLVRKEKHESDAVFTGKVKRIVEDQRYGWVSVEFEVLDLWKGRLNKNSTVLTGRDDGDCGFKFKRGETYLVYVPSRSIYSTKALSTHICTRTARLAEAKADIPHLGKRKQPSN